MPDLYREPVDENSAAGVPGSPVLSGSIESEIAELENQLAQKRSLLGAEKERPLERVLGAEKPAPSSVSLGQLSPAPTVVPVSVPPQAKPEVGDFKNLEKNQQLKNLVDLAFQKGISYAADVARDLDNAYLMDEFHDTLVDKLHKELVERGKLEEI